MRAGYHADGIKLQIVNPADGGQDVGFDCGKGWRAEQTLRGKHQGARLW